VPSEDHSVPDRPQLAAQRREIRGKHVARLRRDGVLPAVVYGHGHESEAIQLNAKEFDVLRRHAGRNALVDLKVGGSRATPVIVHDVQMHPVNRSTLHVDFYVVKMTEELTVDVPIVVVGEAEAAEQGGGTLLHLLSAVTVRALPTSIPQGLELDVTPLTDFETVLHVRDLRVPSGVTVVTDPDESIARVQPPRVEEEPVAAEAEEAEAEGAEVAEVEGAAAEEPPAGEGAAES
jgi:large subunit ribosomal protein L25